MKRDPMIAALADRKEVWDIAIIGGGATGLGIAVDAASRGYRTLLVEQNDFAKGTSSRSTKLIHGGVRYLQQGNVGLVLEALRERGRLTRNAPHLVSPLAFIVPNYTWWEAPFYGVGLKLYDTLAGELGLGPSKHLSRAETLEQLPTLEPRGLRGGTIYFDGQFDDARLAIALARTAVDHGAIVVNYARVIALRKQNGLVRGLVARDEESQCEYEITARVVINATGVFTDSVRRLDDAKSTALIAPSQGVHLVLDKSFLPGESAIMVPRTDDGRVLFAIPWHDRALIGTTDTPVTTPSLEPRALRPEIDFLLTHAARYLTQDPRPRDVLSVFAGLRPLVRSERGRSTALVPRDHAIFISKSGLVTITGGKWTTYRKMAEDALNQAALVGGLAEKPCVTAELPLHGRPKVAAAAPEKKRAAQSGGYGTDLRAMRDLSARVYGKPGPPALHPTIPYTELEILWAVRHEMARTVEDVLSRRTRVLLMNAKLAAELAPVAAGILAREHGHDETWIKAQVQTFRDLAAGYVLPENNAE